MKKFLITFLLLISTPVFANDLIRIKCEGVYGVRQLLDVKTQTVLSEDETMLNKEFTRYFYIDNEKKEIYDGEKRKLQKLTFTENKISVFDVTKINETNTHAEMFEIDRNTGILKGTFADEYIKDGKHTRLLLQIYGTCSKIESKPKF